MTDAKATICYLNGLSLNTINEVEKILRSLPQKGNRCEVQMSKPLNVDGNGRGTADVVASKVTVACCRCETHGVQLSTITPVFHYVFERNGSRNESKSLQIRDKVKPLALSPVEKSQKNPKNSKNLKSVRAARQPSLTDPPTDLTSSPSYSSRSVVRKSPKIQCKVMADQIRATPIVSYNGVILEIDVEVMVPAERNGACSADKKKRVKMEIECPDFVPARIRIGDKWKSIV